MLSNGSLRIAGVAMLGTAALLGTNAANAVLNLDTDEDAAIYARETLVTEVEGKDGNTYYEVIDSAANHNVTAALGLEKDSDDTLVITYQLTNMVFGENLTDDSLTGVAGTSLASKGKMGDSSAIFRVSGTADQTAADVLTLNIGSLGVSPDSSGSIVMTVKNITLAEVLPNPADAEHKADFSGAVAVVRGLQEEATPMDVTATVEHQFKSFDGASTASLGTFMVSSSADARAASSGNLIGFTANVEGNDLIDPTAESVTITGDFSFATMAWLDAVADMNDMPCDDASKGDLLKKDGDEVTDTMELEAVAASEVMTAQHLCIAVASGDDAMAIAASEEPYMITTSYTRGTTNADFPPSGDMHEMGSIVRDGTTVRLPYLTTNERFNQRIYIVNRSSTAAEYVITFHGEGDEAGMDAEGTLAGGGTTTILSVGDDDVVTIGPGRTSTSGTIVIEAQPKLIDVATSQINRELGTSDTVVYQED